MFEGWTDAELVVEIEKTTRAEAITGARRRGAIAELTRRRTEPDGEHEFWVCDQWATTAAEVAAAMGIGHKSASREMSIGMALLERLPKVAALYAEGRINSQLVATITWRTHLVNNDEALRHIDAEIADRVGKWGPLGIANAERAIDALIDRYDPGALRRRREAARNRDVAVGKPDDETGTASLWGRLYATDAALLKRRLRQMTLEVCDDDPRTMNQRRADALGALAAGADKLTCQCGKSDCPSAGDDPRATSFSIHLIAEEAALGAEPDPYLSGSDETRPIPADDCGGRPPKKLPAPAVILGGAAVPTSLLAELIANGAQVQRMSQPCDEAEPGYRPSRKLARSVRMRDMTCRFPGCDRPADFCDFDHTVPYPAGATHASNGKCLCRFHHLLKTFCGWFDRQSPDGTVVWTAPTGRKYVTHPGSRMFFPGWQTTSAELSPSSAPPGTGQRGMKMPRRRRTRAQDRARQIEAERALNDEYVAQRKRPPPN